MNASNILKIFLVGVGVANGLVILGLSAYMAFDKVRRVIQGRKRT